jgi:uncharacterized protein (DUF1499 family)
VTWAARAALALAVLAAAALLASGPGTRLGLWPFQGGFLLLRVAAITGALAAAVALAGLCIPKMRAGRRVLLAAALALGAASAAGPLEFQRQARSVPPINDLSTDFANPETAGPQRAAYPDIVPLDLQEPPAAAYARALAAAGAMGWEVTSRDPAAARFEAVATTGWFGFKDDILVRVSARGAGSRVDMRSKSRVGRGDAGANARRIRTFFERLK